MSADIVRIGSRTFTRSRALAMGFIDAKGKVTELGEAATATTGSSKPARNKDRKAQREAAEGVETTADGVVKAKRQPKPLVPKNVDPVTKEPVEDPEELAAIASRTANIEAAGSHRARVEPDGSDEARKALIEDSISEHDALQPS